MFSLPFKIVWNCISLKKDKKNGKWRYFEIVKNEMIDKYDYKNIEYDYSINVIHYSSFYTITLKQQVWAK